jgi:uncharacterized protein (TIGR02452 family)
MKQVKEKGQDINTAETIMKERMRFALSLYAKEKINTIILGAYGCGVFGNDPDYIARWWKELLIDKGYGAFSNKALFAVLDKSEGENIRAFEKEFKIIDSSAK